MLHATIHRLVDETDDNRKTRHHHAATMVRFEEALNKHIDQKLKLHALCAEIGVPERTLRLRCTEFIGLSPTGYLLLRRLNMVRSALRRADPSTTTVARVARDHQFLELGALRWPTAPRSENHLPPRCNVIRKHRRKLPKAHSACEAFRPISPSASRPADRLNHDHAWIGIEQRWRVGGVGRKAAARASAAVM
jgi:AraC-like DNA-binding protein